METRYIVIDVETGEPTIFSEISSFLRSPIFYNKRNNIINTIYPPIKFLNHYIYYSDILEDYLPVEYEKIVDHVIETIKKKIENKFIDEVSYTISDDFKRKYTIKKTNKQKRIFCSLGNMSNQVILIIN